MKSLFWSRKGGDNKGIGKHRQGWKVVGGFGQFVHQASQRFLDGTEPRKERIKRGKRRGVRTAWKENWSETIDRLFPF